ncbi:MAG: hypothetical protein DID91_2727704349 [Candidatus Nitrotoga sp. MKT]|nr:MAG: hypothetical protein DID91_2727704349 [Candidatus Nitrotoga sp. MKT]
MCEPTRFDCEVFYTLVRTKVSGGKIRSGTSKPTTNRAAQSSLRLEATPLHKSQSVLRAYFNIVFLERMFDKKQGILGIRKKRFENRFFNCIYIELFDDSFELTFGVPNGHRIQ